MKAIVVGLFRNEELRRSIGRSARERAIQEFNRDRVVARYVSAYHRLLEA